MLLLKKKNYIYSEEKNFEELPKGLHHVAEEIKHRMKIIFKRYYSIYLITYHMLRN